MARPQGNALDSPWGTAGIVQVWAKGVWNCSFPQPFVHGLLYDLPASSVYENTTQQLRHVVLLDPSIKRPKNPAYLRKYVYRSTSLGIITHNVSQINAIWQNICQVPIATWYLFTSLPEMIVSLGSAPSRQLPSLARDQTRCFEACGLKVKCSVRVAWAAVPCPLCSPGNWRSSLSYMQILTSL